MTTAPREFPEFAPPPKRLSRRAKWDLALAAGGFVYILLTLALSLNAPLVSILFIGLIVREWVSGRNR